MAIKGYEAYVERIRKMKPNVYINGKKVDRTGEYLNGGLYVMKQTYDCAEDPRYEEVCTATSHITGEKVNRFNHIHQSMDDLLKKQRMTRLLCHRVGGCIQRCMGVDAINALSVVTYDMDEALGTDYNKRFLQYLKYFQDNDLIGNCAQTDVKGDRMKRPHEQEDPDMYVRVVETDVDGIGIDGKPCKGIIVRGAKCCNSNAPYVDEIIVTPTRFMGGKDAAYAVSFALPADWEGVKLMALPGGHTKRKHLDAPMGHVGDVESMTVFDDVFVPNDRVFMNGLDNPGVVQYAGYLAIMFAHFHRHSYTGCKTAISEVMASQCALVAEVNGIEKAEHVKDKICHIISVAELVFASGQAAAYRGVKMPSGTYAPDEILTNAGRKLAGENIYGEYNTLADLAGGMSATLPLEEEFFAPETAELCNKYLRRNRAVSAEDTHRCFRMVENQLCGHFAGATMVAGVHGGGSPIMETIAMMGAYDVEGLKNIAKYLCGINEDLPLYERETATPRRMLEKFKKFEKK